MELDASLSWLALALTPGLACRWCARLLRKIGCAKLDHLIASFSHGTGVLQSARACGASYPIIKLSIIRMLLNARKGTGRHPQPFRLPPPELDRAGTILRRCCKFTIPGARQSAWR